MARWDKFLDGASQGYGVGFNRYEQYQDANDRRLNKADAAAVQENMALTRLQDPSLVPGSEPANQPRPDGAYPIYDGSGNKVWRLPEGAVGGAAPQTAVGGQTTPPAALNTAPAMGAAYDWPSAPPAEGMDRITTKNGEPVDVTKTMPQEHRDAIIRGDDIGKKKVAVPAKPAPASGNAPTRIASTTEREAIPTSEKGALKSSVDEVLGYVIPKGEKKGAVDVTKVVGNQTSTREAWQNVEKHLMNIAVRNGDVDSMMQIPEKLAGMQQKRMTDELTKAIQLVGVDPQAAASALYKAYSYYPDGVDVDIRMREGQLIGYGFDETSGKFKGGVNINEESLTRMLESIKDPIAFQANIRASKIASEQSAYDRTKDKRDYLLDVFTANSDHALNLAKGAKYKADGVLAYTKALNEGAGEAGAFGWKDVQQKHNYIQDVQKAIADRVNSVGGLPLTDEQRTIWDANGYTANAIAISMANNVDPTRNYLSTSRIMDMTSRVVGAELKMRDFTGDNATQDRFMQTLSSEGIDVKPLQTMPNHLGVTMDGEFGIFNALSTPALTQYAVHPQQKAAPQTAVPAAPDPMESFNEGRQSPISKLGDAVSTGIGDAVDATGEFLGAQQLDLTSRNAASLWRNGSPIVEGTRNVLVDGMSTPEGMKMLEERLPEDLYAKILKEYENQ